MSTLGRYELIKLLGRGGDGEVWEAIMHGPLGFEKPVAVKVLLSEEEAQGARLADEARIGVRLSHPNVVAIHEFGRADERYYIAMELVSGGSASSIRRDGRLSVRAVVELASQVCDGLHHIHTCGFWDDELVHRDIKPANLLITPQGQVKIADLGIASFATQSTTGAGTPGYMAPEQIQANPEPRSDLFSLGVTIFSLCTGLRLFGSGIPALQRALTPEEYLQKSGALINLVELHPGTAEVVSRCLRKNPEHRYSSALHLKKDLVNLLSNPLPGDPLRTYLLPLCTTPEVVVRKKERAGHFVGRRRELTELGELLAFHQLVFLIGPSGVGKTQIARSFARNGHLEAVFVDLTEAESRVGICVAIGRALDCSIGEQMVSSLVEEIIKRGPMLLVVDNLEQIVEEIPPILQELVTKCSDLRVLGTSQLALGLSGERMVRVGPLPLNEAMKLLIELAPVVNKSQAKVIVQQVDCLPLAVELAAALCEESGADHVLQLLQQPLPTLSTNDVHRPQRHRSLEASFAATWRALPQWAVSAMAQLAVFADGFSLEAAQAVLLVLGRSTLEVLHWLADHHLVNVNTSLMRFRILRNVRWYALKQRSELSDNARERHMLYFAQWGVPSALAAFTQIKGSLDRVEQDLENLVDACHYAIKRNNEPVAAAICTVVSSLFQRRGPVSVAESLVASVAAMKGENEAELLANQAFFNAILGRYELTLKLAATSREIARKRSQPKAEGLALMYLAMGSHALGEYADSKWAFEASLKCFQEAGEERLQAACLSNLGMMLITTGDSEEAVGVYESTLELARLRDDNEMFCTSYGNLGLALQQLGRAEESVRSYRLGLSYADRLNNQRQEACIRSMLGEMLGELGQLQHSVEEFEASVNLQRSLGTVRVLGTTLTFLARSLLLLGRRGEASARLEESIAVMERHDLVGMGQYWMVKAMVMQEEGDLPGSNSCLEQSEALFESAEDSVSLAQVLYLRALWNHDRLSFEKAQQTCASMALPVVLSELQSKAAVLFG